MLWRLSALLLAVAVSACGDRGSEGVRCDHNSIHKLPGVLANNIACARCTLDGKPGYLLCYEAKGP